MSNEVTLKCPHCNQEIDINEAVLTQLEGKFNKDTQEQREKYKIAVADLKSKEESLKKQEEQFDSKLQDALKLQLKAKEQNLRKSITKEITESQSQAQALLQDELDNKSKQLQEFNRTKAELESIKREKDELASKIKAELEQEASKNLQDALTKANQDNQIRLEKLQADFDKDLSQKLEGERLLMEQTIKKSLTVENNKKIQEMQELLEAKSEQVKELETSRAEIAKLKMEKDEIEAKAKADAEIFFYEKLTQEKQKAVQEITSQNELKLKESDEKMKQLQEQLQITQRKLEQGSMQMQGEVQELAIEEYLAIKFPLDTIEEIKKGQRGADCLQIVNTNDIANCGKIYYESKRTKDFQKSWIEKFKADMRDKGVDIGVLVTEVLPSTMDRMGFYDGIWVCTYEEFKGAVSLLRDSVIKINIAKKSQEGKSDKMSLLYTYLTSNEFSMQVEAIVEGFSTMQSDLDKEKRAMMKIWKQREKQLDKVLENTIGMYGSIKGIAGNAIGNVQALELGYVDEEEQ